MLGKKLKAARRERGYSLEELARRTGFSKSFLSQVENGKNSPSISGLTKITQALGIALSEVFSDERAGQVCFQKRADRPAFDAAQGRLRLAFGASQVPNRKMEPIFLTLEPGGESQGTYTHDGEEFGTVLEGILVFELGGREYVMEAGDSIYFSSTIPHRWRNPGPGVMRALWVVTPPTF